MFNKKDYIAFLGRVLRKLDKGYKTREFGTAYGLCAVSTHARNANDYDYYVALHAELNKLKERRNVFFTVEGHKTDCKEQFIWRAQNPEPRIKFINRLIKQNQ